jgi:hypothetical protein
VQSRPFSRTGERDRIWTVELEAHVRPPGRRNGRSQIRAGQETAAASSPYGAPTPRAQQGDRGDDAIAPPDDSRHVTATDAEAGLTSSAIVADLVAAALVERTNQNPTVRAGRP